jgi:hypothetical protein
MLSLHLEDFREALKKNRATVHAAMMPQWVSAGWGDEMAVNQSLFSAARKIQLSLSPR